MIDICRVRIKARTGWHADNQYWRIGAYLKFVPTQYGPEGLGNFDVCECKDASLATHEGAQLTIAFIDKHYKGVECEAVPLSEVK